MVISVVYEDYDLDCGRIIIFSTRENLKLLFKSEIWFLDGTFDTVPSMFFQLFTIMENEGWHNRFQLLVGRRHPSLYAFFKELQKEQAAVEYMLRELRLGKKIKKLPPNKTLLVEERIHNAVSKWQEHVDEDRD